MNGMNTPFAPPGAAAWQEHRTTDGRVYYYNSQTKVTQWTKPEDLMSAAEVCMLLSKSRQTYRYANVYA
jgi:pre-mRNA-processing factor 40